MQKTAKNRHAYRRQRRAGGRRKLKRGAVGFGDRVGERVEAQVAGHRHGQHHLGRGEEVVRQTVAVVAAGKVAIERGENRVRHVFLLLSAGKRVCVGKGEKTDDVTLQKVEGREKSTAYLRLGAREIIALPLANARAARSRKHVAAKLVKH